jgi:hypothetical protein
MTEKQNDTSGWTLARPSRRRVLRQGVAVALGAAGLSGSGWARAQGTPPARTDNGRLRVTQLLDMSPDQQQLSRDYSTGIRLAFAEMGKAGATVPQLTSVETDGSVGSLRQALQAVREDATQVALLGTVGEALALVGMAESDRMQMDIANVAPWLADARMDGDARLFALFASREEQVRYVLRSLATLGVQELGLVYPDAQGAAAMRSGMASLGQRLQLRTHDLVIGQGRDVADFGARLPANAPYFLLFMGGAIELALFTQGLARGQQRRYLLCLSDVDTNTFMQVGPGKSTPVIFTDVVPNPRTSKLPVVRAYREALGKLFDEAPSSVSLAGYLAGRYAATVLAAAGPNASRARVLSEFQRRRPIDLDGWRLEFGAEGRASKFVSQTLLNTRGEVVG